MTITIAIVHLADGRSDFYAKRQSLIVEELQSISWLRDHFDILESETLCSSAAIASFAQNVRASGANSIIAHIPIWANPIFTVKLHNHLALPILLLGNDRPDTSSTVGVLGAGGALDQIGCEHVRIFEHQSQESRNKVVAFCRAAEVRNKLRGQTLGLFGGRGLGIFTASADPAQWQSLFGVDIEILDQYEIVKVAESLPIDEVERHTNWLLEQVAGVTYSGVFTQKTLSKQVRSYLATKILAEKFGFDFIGVKCQPELSDGYVSQCVAHSLINGIADADGEKPPLVHACESDADGALTMQILHLLSEGKSTALLDLRWFNRNNGTWTLANCGAISPSFFTTDKDNNGLSKMRIMPHVFGQGGGGALPGVVAPQQVTLARLCRKSRQYWMAIVSGRAEAHDPAEMENTTAVFPQVFLKSSAGIDFSEKFGSNHIHMVSGDYTEELIAFCRLVGIPWQVWS